MSLFYHKEWEIKMEKNKKRKPIIANRLSGESDMKNFITPEASALKPQEHSNNTILKSDV